MLLYSWTIIYRLQFINLWVLMSRLWDTHFFFFFFFCFVHCDSSFDTRLLWFILMMTLPLVIFYSSFFFVFIYTPTRIYRNSLCWHCALPQYMIWILDGQLTIDNLTPFDYPFFISILFTLTSHLTVKQIITAMEYL